MELGVGSILEGKVTGITKFGAFVSLGENKSGLVHISEIANTYVNDIHEHLQEGQAVKVKVLAIDENGRINLSIKRALPSPGQGQGSARGAQGGRAAHRTAPELRCKGRRPRRSARCPHDGRGILRGKAESFHDRVGGKNLRSEPLHGQARTAQISKNAQRKRCAFFSMTK